MKRLLWAFLALLPLSAHAEWDVVAAGPQSAWLMKRGTVHAQPISGAVNVIALVKREDRTTGEQQEFLASVPVAHCGAARGDIRLQPTDGSALVHAAWDRKARAVSDALAAALCSHQRSKQT